MDLKLIKKIETKKDYLVKNAEEFLNSNNFIGEDSQLRNLSEIATSTISTEVVKNFIKYQIGRDNIKGWQLSKSSFGEKLLSKMDEILSEKNDSLTPEQHNEYKINILRLFIGYMVRYHKYQKAIEKSKGGRK